MKKLLPNVALLFFGILAGLAIAEGISRVIYRGPWHERLAKEQLQDDWRARVRRNALGLRDQDYAPTKPPQTRRVLILGDSFTFGSGVTDESAIFPALLETWLNAEFAAHGTTVEVLNAGLPGSLTTAWVKLLEKLKGQFQPDVVLIVFFLRDGSRVQDFVRSLRDQDVARNRESFIYRYLYFFRLRRDSVDQSRMSQNYPKVLYQSYFGDPAQTEEWRIAQVNIRKIKAIGGEAHASVGLVVFPALVELNERYPFKSVCDLITTFGAENGIATHNLLPAFMGKNAADLWVAPGNQHPNALGHRIAAESMLPFVQQLLAQTP